MNHLINEINDAHINIAMEHHKKNLDVLNPLTIELLNDMCLDKEIFADYYLNVNGITNYYCDTCKKDCIGKFYQKYKDCEYEDICLECFEKLKIGDENKKYVAKYPSKYICDLSYMYNIEAIKKIGDHKFLYIVQENNFDSNDEDIHYYLKYYDNGNIIVDHELQTYNPYAGIYDIEINITDDIIIVSYREKHCHCIVKIKPNNDNHKIYFKSKPQKFSRAQNENVKWHEIGDIIEFKVGNTIKKSKTYFGD